MVPPLSQIRSHSLDLTKLLLCFAVDSQCAVVAALLSAPSHTRATAPWRSVNLLRVLDIDMHEICSMQSIMLLKQHCFTVHSFYLCVELWDAGCG